MAGEIVVSGVGTLARSTLAYGLLSGTWTKDREFAEGDHRADRWTKLELEQRLHQLMSLRFLVHGDVATMRAAAVRFVLSNRIVSCAVLGPRSVTQLEDLVREVGMGRAGNPGQVRRVSRKGGRRVRRGLPEVLHPHRRCSNVVRRLYHFGRSVSDLAQACRLMGEGAYDRLHAQRVLHLTGDRASEPQRSRTR